MNPAITLDTMQELLMTKEDLLPELALYYEEPTDERDFPMVRHPLVYSVPHTDQLNAMLNRRYIEKSKAVLQARHEKNWEKVLVLHERAYRLSALLSIADDIKPNKKYWDTVGWVWIDAEHLHNDWLSWLMLFESDRPARKFIMDKSERAKFKTLPEVMTLYRGTCEEELEAGDVGMSWTLSLKVAGFFANRFSRNGVIIQAEVPKSMCLAYMSGRSEEELIVPLGREIKLYTRRKLK